MNNFRDSFFDEGPYYKPGQKDITNILVKIQARPHEIKNYRQLLQKKQEYEKYNTIVIGGFERINQIIDPKASRISVNSQQSNDQIYEVGGICPACCQQIRGKGISCNGCRKIVCRNCIARNRMMKNDTLQKFCQKCDVKYLQALIDKEFLKQLILYQKAFDTLVRQQQTLDTLLSSQKQKIKNQQLSQQKQEVLKNDEKIMKLKHEKQGHKQKLQQIQNKIDWGESMTKGLRVKLRKLKKLLKQSFGSSNSDSAYIEWQPPKAEDDIHMDDDNINQSFITTNFDRTPQEENVDSVDEREFCKCNIY